MDRALLTEIVKEQHNELEALSTGVEQQINGVSCGRGIPKWIQLKVTCASYADYSN